MPRRLAEPVPVAHPAAGVRPRRITLADVASAAGCSTALVSTVINRSSTSAGASAALTRKIRDAARRLGYRPDFASQSLARRSTRTIGVYVPPDPWAGIGQPYEGAIVTGIEQVCRTHGFDVLAINLSGPGTPDVCSHKFAEKRIDGLLLLHVADDADWVEPLLRQSPNVATVNYYGPAPVDRINFDDRAATRLAVEHLVALGHRRIAFLGSYLNPLGPGADLRCAGYRAGMADAGLTIDPQWVWHASNVQLMPAADVEKSQGDAVSAATHFARLGPQRPTALVAYGDLEAVRAIRQLAKLGFRCPADFSVVGVDGSELGELITPELTSIRQPFAQMGQLATQCVVERAQDRDRAVAREPLVRLIAPDLIVRASTAPPSSPPAAASHAGGAAV